MTKTLRKSIDKFHVLELNNLCLKQYVLFFLLPQIVLIIFKLIVGKLYKNLIL